MSREGISHVLSTAQFSDAGLLNALFDSAEDLQQKTTQGVLASSMRGRILASLFYEPSTRTRFSFETAMQRLGGSVVSTENASQFSSAVKGETLEDTIRVVSGYADVVVLRHPEQGAAKRASLVSSVPIMNAGDGAGEHPTQALLDLYTIRRELGKIDGLKVALVGDLLNGRTIHSLLYLLSVYKKVKVYLVSPPRLCTPQHYKEHLQNKKVEFEELSDLGKILGEVDVVYATRLQKERFQTTLDSPDYFVINEASLSLLKEKSILLHPLPRVNEISPEVDKDPRAAYFRQARNGVFIRMALLESVLGKRVV
ncbi:MAG TPA: aspartate carbamoyltransferase [archaeon]|nr:aspartate carbamoyltransferase [archaeon]HLD81539.1 aspartate carbamoyltransferase [archaeon]